MRIHVSERSLEVVASDILVAGSVDEYEVVFDFDQTWQGYAVMAVFKTHNGILKEVLVADSKAEVPWEVLEEPGTLTIGVYGLLNNSSRPTIWGEPQTIYAGTERGEAPAEPETTPWDSAIETMGQMVQDMEEAAAVGGSYYTPSVDPVSGELSWAGSQEGMPAVASANIKGPKGDDRVYVGSNTPPSGAEIWIDPTEEGDLFLTVDENGDATFAIGTLTVDADGNAVLY